MDGGQGRGGALLGRIEATVEGEIVHLRCGELLDRQRALVDVGRDFPIEGVVPARWRTRWLRAAKRLHFAAHRAGCISKEGSARLDRTAEGVAGRLGDREAFDWFERYEMVVREVYSGSVAGG